MNFIYNPLRSSSIIIMLFPNKGLQDYMTVKVIYHRCLMYEKRPLNGRFVSRIHGEYMPV